MKRLLIIILITSTAFIAWPELHFSIEVLDKEVSILDDSKLWSDQYEQLFLRPGAQIFKYLLEEYPKDTILDEFILPFLRVRRMHDNIGIGKSNVFFNYSKNEEDNKSEVDSARLSRMRKFTRALNRAASNNDTLRFHSYVEIIYNNKLFNMDYLTKSTSQGFIDSLICVLPNGDYRIHPTKWYSLGSIKDSLENVLNLTSEYPCANIIRKTKFLYDDYCIANDMVPYYHQERQITPLERTVIYNIFRYFVEWALSAKTYRLALLPYTYDGTMDPDDSINSVIRSRNWASSKKDVSD